MSWTKEELEAYERRGIYIQDERGHVEQALEDGFKKGEESGFKKGQQTIARNMLLDGMDPETIFQLTGVSTADIKKL